ncbi:MAG: tetratricopeptide repeat protein, partial [Terriglobales bacterium]
MKCKTIADLERFLEIQEQALGQKAPEIATTLSKLAELHIKQGTLEKAEQILTRAYEIRESLNGFHRQGIEETEVRLQEVRLMIGKRSGTHIPAAELVSASIPVAVAAVAAVAAPVATASGTVTECGAARPAAQATAEPPHVEGEPHVNPPAMRISNAKQITAAIGELEVELELLQNMVGPTHTSVADMLTKIADLYCRLRMYNKMEPLLVDALKIRETACGPDHPSVSTELKNLGALYCAQERFALAEPLLKRSITIREKAYGRSHPRVADVEEHLAGLLRKTNRLAQAEALEQHVDEIRNQYSGGISRNNT